MIRHRIYLSPAMRLAERHYAEGQPDTAQADGAGEWRFEPSHHIMSAPDPKRTQELDFSVGAIIRRRLKGLSAEKLTALLHAFALLR